MSTPYAIEVKHLWFFYDGTEILRDVNFTLRKGEFLGIIGPNGGGKTTFLKLLLGILKPDRGAIRILGEEPHNASHRVGYVPQRMDFSPGFPISVADVVLMGRLAKARIGKRYSRLDRNKVGEVLKKVGMWEHRQRPIGKLSGGQRQRVFIARALATDPEILFLDEPTASVDPEFQTDLYDFLKELNERVTIVVITHDIGVVSSYMKSIACVNRHVIFHEGGKITKEMLDMSYQCPVDLIAHGLPHRVLHSHEED
ncbi:MAG: ABC transporter ATP-binding protein [Deltaproteobacteria bacterium]|nr:ABC transporter ATP-binding protein [Deltaproteobacteria bacterium]